MSIDDPIRRIFQAAWPYILVLGVGLFVLLPRLGEVGLWDPWEPKYAQSAREMAERDSYVVPFYRDEVRLTKPILAYWGILLGSTITGKLDEFGARLVGVGLALAALAGVFYAVSLLRGRQAGLIAALVLATAPQFYFLSRAAMPDVYLLTSLGSAVLFLTLGLFGPDRRRDLHFGISYASLGLAVLAKGPVIAAPVYLVPLAIYALGIIDWPWLVEPPLRRATFRAAAVSTIGSVALLTSLGISAMFGLSEAWWGYSERSRAEFTTRRDEVAWQFDRFHVGQFALLLLALGSLVGVVRIVRRGASGILDRLMAAGFTAVAAVSLATLTLGTGGQQVFVAAALASIVISVVLLLELWRYARASPVWSRLEPYFRPIARQIGLFTAVFLIVAGPWHVAIVLKMSHGYFTDFILKHNVSRASETINQSGGADFYLGVLVFAFFPWSCLVPLAVASVVPWRDRGALQRFAPEAFLLIGSAVILVLFSGASTKFPHYLSPILIPLAVLIGLTVNRMLTTENRALARLGWLVSAALYLPPMLDLSRERGMRSMLETFTVKRYIPQDLEAGGYLSALLWLPFAIMLLAAVWRSRVVLGLLVTVAALFANYNTRVLIPTVSPHKSMKLLCEAWLAERDDDAPLCFRGALKHGVFFYTDSNVVRVERTKGVVDYLEPGPTRLCIIERDEYSDVLREYERRFDASLRVVEDSHFDYVLIKNDR